MRFLESAVLFTLLGGGALAACGNSQDTGGGSDAGVDGSAGDSGGGESCSTDVLHDVHHCGGCTTDCTTLPHVDATKVTCEEGACSAAGACLAGFADCSATAPGCETTLGTANACAACDDSCGGSSPVCSAHSCVSVCPYTSPDTCDGMCTDKQTDDENCGSCGNVCAGDGGNTRGACVAGVCESSCKGGFNLCGGSCVAEDDVNACGASCKACPTPPLSTASCVSGRCESGCNAGAHACGGACVDDRAVATCGSSCTACPTLPNATSTCDGTSCGFTCEPGFTTCSAGATCATNLNDDPYNCGACGHSCLHGACSAGACQPFRDSTERGPQSFASYYAGYYEASGEEITYAPYAGLGHAIGGMYADVATTGGGDAAWNDVAGDLVWADPGLVDPVSIPVPAGHSPVSLAFSPIGIAWTDASGNLFNSDLGNPSAVLEASTDGSPGTCAYSGGQRFVLFETSSGNVWRWDGYHQNAVTHIAQVAPNSAALMTDTGGSTAYLGDSSGAVFSIPTAGGALTKLTTRPAAVASLAVDGNGGLYILTDAGLDRYDLASGAVTSLATVGAGGSRCHALILTPTEYFWSGAVQGVFGIYALAR